MFTCLVINVQSIVRFSVRHINQTYTTSRHGAAPFKLPTDSQRVFTPGLRTIGLYIIKQTKRKGIILPSSAAINVHITCIYRLLLP